MYLVDTNVLSECLRPQPLPQVLAWFEQAGDIGLSVVTVEEMVFGLSWRPSPQKQQLLRHFLDQAQIYDITRSVAERAALLRGGLRAQGVQRSVPDMLIAATALEHRLVLVTRNLRDFAGCALELYNPFDA